ncbi:hypothetical protein V6N13_087104 [Hibiscus sabdariffa]
MRVNEAGLQENIRFQLYDYRQLPSTYKYDRIISCSYRYQKSETMNTDEVRILSRNTSSLVDAYLLWLG